MTLSVWRYAHLTLAVLSALFLVVASLTGIALAVDAIVEKAPPYRVENFEDLTLAEVLPKVTESYLEVSEITTNHNQFTILQGLDADGNEINAYINPQTGAVLGPVENKSAFIQWVTALHRSLFLKETGRLLIGIASFLLVLIALSGMALVVQRQKGWQRFFTKIIKEDFSQYYHVVLGRLMLIPIFIMALSGTYLSMQRFQLFPEAPLQHQKPAVEGEIPSQQDMSGFEIFKNTPLADVKKISFPFDTEDPEEYYILELNDREVYVNQFTGANASEVRYPVTVWLESLSMDLHTGRGSVLWAIILAVASANVLFFIYSGFTMTLRRRETHIKNKYSPDQCKFVLLVGSENGSTLRFANAIHQQLLAHGHASYLGGMNDYATFAEAEHLIIFTSTYGLGDAPSNAGKFLALINQHIQRQNISVSVVGFGSRAYPDFCGFAIQVEAALADQSWCTMPLPLHTVDDKSPEQFTEWVQQWSAQTGIPLSSTPASYASKPAGMQKMTVVKKTEIVANDHTFALTLRPGIGTKFKSGDLLAVYPQGDGRERFYSVAKIKDNIHLVVKLHESGLGSGYLYALKPGAVIKGRLVKNKAFHFPKKVPAVVMIANGTGIAPFLGMISENNNKTECHLYCGFSNETATVATHKQFAAEQLVAKHLKSFHIAFSREQNHCYVMDLIQKNAAFFAGLLQGGGTIMICGSLQMQRDVEIVLDAICKEANGIGLDDYKANGQLLADCY